MFRLYTRFLPFVDLNKVDEVVCVSLRVDYVAWCGLRNPVVGTVPLKPLICLQGDMPYMLEHTHTPDSSG